MSSQGRASDDVLVTEKKERGNWQSHTEFLLSCLGYAIGLGNIWRFPYLCYRNGGGAFLVPYFLMLMLCGLPLYFMETSIGQFSSVGCLSVFRISPIFKGAGMAIVVVNILCTSYYSLILTYPLLFVINSFGETLPWVGCDNPWNTEHCRQLTDLDNVNFTSRVTNASVSTPADEFFHNKILEISGGINELGSIVWPIFWGNALAWAVMFACIAKGVKSVGKVVYFTATFPFVVLLVLFIRGVTLPGAMEGIRFYIYPQWEQLTNLRVRPSSLEAQELRETLKKVWADAAIQIFYSLGPGWGGIINMASYNKFNNNNLSDSLLVPLVNCGTSVFAGFAVFSVLGFMAQRTGVPVARVAAGGPSLAFVAYPAAVALLPWPNMWSILFFAMLFFLGIDTCFVQLEAIITAIIDEYPILLKRKTMVALLSCVMLFCVSMICTTNAGMYIVHLMDWYCASITVILICLIEILIVGWIYGCKNFVRDIEFMNGQTVHWVWPLCWKYVTPIILTFIFITTIVFNVEITYMGKSFPAWSVKVGWCLCLSSMTLIPCYMIYYFIFKTSGTLSERIQSSVRPKVSWGPADEKLASQWRNIVYRVLPLDPKP